MDLSERFARHIAASGLLDGARNVVVACSGGGDSTALLLLLHDWVKEQDLPIVAMHVHHGLRGTPGEEDALAVEHLARTLGVPFVLRPVDVPANRRKGESLEAAARRLRYAALLSLAAELGPGTLVATGHTRDDQAETVLLNLHRHAGRTRGGIRERREDGVVRPLLLFPREELRALLAARCFAFREDETNENERLLRNRIRRRDLPALEEAFPGSAARLARAGEAWSRRLSELDRRIDAALAAAGAPLAGPWPREIFEALGPETAGRLLVRAAGERGAIPGRRQVMRVTGRLLSGETRIAESLAGLRISADARAVRLAFRPRPPARLAP